MRTQKYRETQMIIQEAIQVRVDSETEGLCSNPPLPTELSNTGQVTNPML